MRAIVRVLEFDAAVTIFLSFDEGLIVENVPIRNIYNLYYFVEQKLKSLYTRDKVERCQQHTCILLNLVEIKMY